MRYFGALLLVVVSGCGLSPVAREALREARDTAYERARVFRAMAPRISARNPEEERAVAEWCVSHQAGLDALARGLDAAVRAIE